MSLFVNDPGRRDKVGYGRYQLAEGIIPALQSSKKSFYQASAVFDVMDMAGEYNGPVPECHYTDQAEYIL